MLQKEYHLECFYYTFHYLNQAKKIKIPLFLIKRTFTVALNQ